MVGHRLSKGGIGLLVSMLTVPGHPVVDTGRSSGPAPESSSATGREASSRVYTGRVKWTSSAIHYVTGIRGWKSITRLVSRP